MAQEKIEILFKPKGSQVLITAVKNLDVATKRLQGRTSIYEKELKKMGLTQKQVNKFLKQGTNNLRLQTGAFATLRSNLLLYSFGVGLAQRAIVSFVEKAGKVEDLSRGFSSLTASMGSSADVMNALKKATDGTVNSTDLMQQANNAMMLGIVKSKEEMAELFDTAQRLGQALGKDTVSSIESLVTGMGRQSRLMLDNLGIIVKSSDAYERYAQKLGTTKDSLTDMQKKEAFNQEVLRVSKKIVDDLGIEHLSTNAKIQVMNSSVHDLSVAFGEFLIPVLNIMAKSLLALSEHFDAEKIKNYAVALVGVGSAYLIVSGTALKAAKASLLFIKTNKALLGVMLAVTAVAEFLDRQFDLFGLNTDELENSIGNLNDNLENFDSNLESIDTRIKKINSTLSYNISNIKLNASQTEALTDIEAKELIIKEKLSAATNLYNQQLITEEEFLTRINNLTIEQTDLELQAIEQKIAKYREYQDAVMGISSSMLALNLQNIENSRQEALSAAESIRSERRKKAEIDKINQKYDNKVKKQKQAMQKVKVAEAISNTALAITKYHSEGKLALAILAGIQGAISIATIKAEKYQYGGMVGGRRHSQGGTMIEAERGEYVVSRRGVDAIGIEALNRINAGQGGGSVNVTFAGNVLSKDFIEDEAIPQIKEAIRRGADIGVG